MTATGYAVVSLDALPWTRHGGETAWAALTGPLGATETSVDAVRLGSDDVVELAAAPEQLLVPLDGAATLDGPSTRLSPPAVALVPAGVAGTLRSDGPATVLVVGSQVAPEPNAAPRAVDVGAAEFVVPSTSAVATAFLTAPLGCAGMKVNARRLEPGQAVPYHTEGDQEELFVPVRGPATLCVADEVHPMTVGTVARIAPEVPRSAVNDGEEDAVWVMVGAPPTGGPTDWDPGAEILE